MKIGKYILTIEDVGIFLNVAAYVLYVYIVWLSTSFTIASFMYPNIRPAVEFAMGVKLMTGILLVIGIIFLLVFFPFYLAVEFCYMGGFWDNNINRLKAWKKKKQVGGTWAYAP